LTSERLQYNAEERRERERETERKRVIEREREKERERERREKEREGTTIERKIAAFAPHQNPKDIRLQNTNKNSR
jgi:hypothetical protein